MRFQSTYRSPLHIASRKGLLVSVSAAALVSILAASPAYAQLAARRSATLTAPNIAPRATVGQQRARVASEALDRSVVGQRRADDIRAFVTQARAAAMAPRVGNGLVADGLVVARGVTAAQLAAGATLAARDTTGRATWQGAALPTESTANGQTLVTITQNESRAILSWDRFDVGSNTTVQFDQKVNGVGQKDWVALNRVVDPNASASRIQGAIKADGTVVVINRNGLIFGNGAKVNANSLLASTLEIGNAVSANLQFRVIPTDSGSYEGLSVAQRNVNFLQNGLLLTAPTLSATQTLAPTLTAGMASGFIAPTPASLGVVSGPLEGSVTVERGANLSAGTGGFVIITAPNISNDGQISAPEGQVSLQAGRAISVTPSTGGAQSADPNIRGLILRTAQGTLDDIVTNTGLIEAVRGHVSLGAGLTGTVENKGLIASTTSVSRNGSISLTAGRIRLGGAANAAQASGLVIRPDTNGETVPQGTAEDPPGFKQSVIDIGAAYIATDRSVSEPLGTLGPADIQIGDNALILAPNANVSVGGRAGESFALQPQDIVGIQDSAALLAASHVRISPGALIDISGVKDVQLDASRNSLLIDPLKRNELRDTPNYRETNTTGDFTLNGASVFVDPRITGVRDDGVAYVGSPLIEAGSAASQIGVTASELMTRGGNLNLAAAIATAPRDAFVTPRITIARDATIDFSGGWVRYADGIVRTSRLLTADGRIVDVSSADPNDEFVAIGDGFTEVQAKFGISRTYANSILQGGRFEYGYDEGRDAGSFLVNASLFDFSGVMFGQAYAGPRQAIGAHRPNRSSAIFSDPRLLQASANELPSSGYFGLSGFLLSDGNPTAAGANIRVGAVNPDASRDTVQLSDATFTAAGLSAVSLQTSGSVSFLKGSVLSLANGGQLSVDAGRTISFDGQITAPAGRIKATTTAYGASPTTGVGGSSGSLFTVEDDLPALFDAAPLISPYDINVTGLLSTAGLWANDFNQFDQQVQGDAWTNGGSVSLTVAPRVLAAIGTSIGSAVFAADLSGSIRVAKGASIDVSSGGYVARDGSLKLDAKGGDVSLINRTSYASLFRTDTGQTPENNFAELPLGGSNQTVAFRPTNLDGDRNFGVVPSLVPGQTISEVAFAPGSIKGFSFGGGGTFTLVAPDMVLGSNTEGKGSRIGLDFLRETGFGALDLSSLKSRIVPGLFSNGSAGNSAFSETTSFKVGAGETLNLSQALLPSFVDAATARMLLAASTGTDIKSIVTPAVPTEAWDQKAVSLRLGGLTEFAVEAGGSVIGAGGASITAPRIFSAGSIRIVGGSVVQQVDLPSIFDTNTVGVRSFSELFGGSTPGQESGFDQDSIARLELLVGAPGQQLRRTNAELFSATERGSSLGTDILAILIGRMGLDEGMRFTGSSSTNLSGGVVYDPRAPLFPNGQRRLDGRTFDGGSIVTARPGQNATFFGAPRFLLNAEDGAEIRLDGASGPFDERAASGGFDRVTQWSDAGRLAIGSGAKLTGAVVSAIGGDDGDADTARTRAAGGIIEWLNPVLRQSDSGTLTNGSALVADQIMAAGFDSLIARGGLTTQGVVDLSLGRSFLAIGGAGSGAAPSANLVLTAAPGSDATITAPYVRLASAAQSVNNLSTTGSGALTLSAGAIDVLGAVEFNVSSRTERLNPGSVTLEATGDIRLIGISSQLRNPIAPPSLTGQLISNGDLTLRAGQVYATTGTGNLQQLIEARRQGRTIAATPFLVGSTNVDGLVKIDGYGSLIPDAPYSAGSHLRIAGANIEQNGVVRAPLGLLEIGNNSTIGPGGGAQIAATASLTFGPNSLTSVSARIRPDGTAALNIPYGTTTDLTEYFFQEALASTVTTPPVGELRLAGADIKIDSAAAGEIRVDARGGGDVFAFEFVPGTGGSRDVLDRVNLDVFSSNDGLQFGDGRQVYAILPKSAANAANVALFDPTYSRDYAGANGDIYGLDAGRSVVLDAAPGIEAGEYLLLPAHYALLPGALRVVENTGSQAPVSGGGTQLRDGSIIVGGTYATAGNGQAESQRRSFTVQSRETFSKFSRIETTSGTTAAERLATRSDATPARLPRDAARVVLSPLRSLEVAGAFATQVGDKGRGAQVDIGGTKIRIAAPGAQATLATSDFVLLTTDTLANFNANSLSIGALRTDNSNGTTTLDVVTNTLQVDGDVNFSAPELLLAVGGPNSLLSIKDGARGAPGARLVATGSLDDDLTGDYIINATAARDASTGPIDQTGAGALVRLANGPERLVTRQGDFALRNSLLPSRLDIGAATLAAESIVLDSSRQFTIDRAAKFGAAPGGTEYSIALSSDNLRIGTGAFHPDVEAQFSAARRVTYRSPDVILFQPGIRTYNDLTIDAPAIGPVQPINVLSPTGDVTITANHVILQNSQRELGACSDIGVRLCNPTSSFAVNGIPIKSTDLILNAKDITFGNGIIRTYGFDAGLDENGFVAGNGILLNAREGVYISGTGRFDTINVDENFAVPINIRTPFIVDRAATDVADGDYQRPDYVFATLGNVTIDGTGFKGAPPAGGEAPGARIAIQAGNEGNAADTIINNAFVRATAGSIDVRAVGSILLQGTTTLSAPGYTRTFSDGLEQVTVSANGGAINLQALGGGAVLDAAATTSLIVDNGVGRSGSLTVLAPLAEVNLAARINPGLPTRTQRTSSLTFDTGLSRFDLNAFVRQYGSQFGGDISVRTGVGGLALSGDQVLNAENVSLTADGGSVRIGGTINVSGDDVRQLALTDPRYRDARVDGGDISLFGRNGLTLESTARLISTTAGYGASDTRQASGGDVTLGIGRPEILANRAALTIAPGAEINVSALRPGDRLISETVIDAQTRTDRNVFRFAESDKGGVVSLRAPILGSGNGQFVNIADNGTIIGAREIGLEAYRSFDLEAIAASGAFSGVSAGANTFLNATSTQNNVGQVRPNFLADNAPGTLVNFIRNFSVTGVNGASLSRYRVRPGIELNAANEVQLVSNWNLGAGQIVNADRTPGTRDALADPAGLLRPSATLGAGVLEVVEGKEAELFEKYVDLTYRVGGSVRGEAPIVSIRSAGNLNINRSITDGFFAFHDRTNPDYISYQLGGGNRTYSPAINFSCGVAANASCNDSLRFDEVVPGPIAGPTATRVSITLLSAVQGEETSPLFSNAPYSASVNRPGTTGTGDPLGVADLFPSLSDGNSVRSSSLRLVGGSALQSANPLQLDRSLTGSVVVSGETSYDITTGRPAVSLGGPLQFSYRYLNDVDQSTTSLLLGGISNFVDFVNGNADLIEEARLDPNYYAVLTWGGGLTGSAAAARAAALAPSSIFVKNGRTFTGARTNRTGVAAPLSDVIAFLSESDFGGTYRRAIEARLPGFNVPTVLPSPTSRLASDTAYVGTKVRTGDGSIAIAASNNVDLRRTAGAVTRNSPAGGVASQDALAQVGGTAVYSAGVRAASADLRGAIEVPAAALSQGFIPGPTSGLASSAVFARNGGSISIQAGNNVLGRRDVFSEVYGETGSAIGPDTSRRTLFGNTAVTNPNVSAFGTNSPTQRWRYGEIGSNTRIAIAPNYFTSGVGALSGGDVDIVAGGAVSDLTIALTNSMVTGSANGVAALVPLGSGSLNLVAGTNLLGGQIDIASGQAVVKARGNVDAAGQTRTTLGEIPSFVGDNRNLLRVRLSDATLGLTSGGIANIGGIGALGVGVGPTSQGLFSEIAGASIESIGSITHVGNRPDQQILSGGTVLSYVLPPSLSLTSLAGDLVFANLTRPAETNSGLTSTRFLYPSRVGQLSLVAAGDISNLALAMSDADPSSLPGSAFGGPGGLFFAFPGVLSTTPDSDLRLYHNRRITHLNDPVPARIFAGGSIVDSVISLPKQSRIYAGKDIIDLYYEGQNINPTDATRIAAGRDIIGTTVLDPTGRSGVQGNNFIIGGPGTVFIEAGRDLGPFVTSATGSARSAAGGIRTVGNEFNPWLPSQGADLYLQFGVGDGVDYTGFQSIYLDPTNLSKLDGDLFEQRTDLLGNTSPDRTRPVYAPILAEWLQANKPALFARVFGDTPPTGDALKTAAYQQYDALYAAFASIDDPLQRNQFLIDKVYFGELQAPANPNGPSADQFVRGYRAVQALYPPALGYTDNLATYDVDPGTISADRPLGVPVKRLVNGQPAVAMQVQTGNVDLRLSTLQTARGGDVTILGPGGNFIAGSVVRTDAQARRRATAFDVGIPQAQLSASTNDRFLEYGNFLNQPTGRINAIPVGFEGILTLRGGAIRGFTDGSFVLNQSRLFTQRGGDIALWSSNGDLNAGQGPRSSSNFPPISLRFSPNGFSDVDSAGSVSGAGIAAFRPAPEIPASSVTLIAPVGTVDAGDAGVRASGDVFVAAARVANADNFKAGGTISGVPSLTVAAPPAVGSSAAAVAANAFRPTDVGSQAGNQSRIFVDVLGYFSGGGECPEGEEKGSDGQCKPK